MSQQRVESSANKEGFPKSQRSLMKTGNSTGPRTLPWSTPALTGRVDERIPLSDTFTSRVEEVRKPCVELTMDAIGREFGEQGS